MKYVKYLIAIVFIIPVFLVDYLLCAPIAWILKKCGKISASEKYKAAMVHFLVKWIMFFLGMRLHVEGRENIPAILSGGAVFANHQSLLDCVVLEGSGLWCGFVGKAELKKIPVLNGLFKTINSVYIDRKSPRDSIKAILTASDNIKKGYVMAIFPEGTRSKDGQIHEFKAGSFKMATRVGAKVYPVAICGSRAILEECHSLLFKHVYVSFGEPIDTKGLGEEEIKSLHTTVENRVREMFEDIQARSKK
jgi:1-acyl-sn-glycerol-3-phosphate acyltransferase